ncbi:hypothetical protein HYU92_04855 [Candidatus Curtissbacteria bacterium]|nr:hypothetical protein [Candidatus Curtissbacteria bacterium]
MFSETFPGRFEEIDRGVILDGAHNPDKIRFLIRLIKKTFDIKHLTFDKEKKKSMVNGQWSIVLILAFKKGKNWKEIIDILMKNLPVKKVIATKFWASTDMGKFQAVEPEEIAEYIRIKNYEIRIKDKENSQEAVFEAVSLAPSTPGVKGAYTPGVSLSLILVTGSLYLVGEVRTMWELPSFSGKAGFGGRAGILSIFAA